MKRMLPAYGKVRPDMGEDRPEGLDWNFLKWVWNFNISLSSKAAGRWLTF